MTRYWTPTRATYFDHVSKARIAEVVSAAVSPKAAADLEKMKKADAAAAAELRLAKAAWLPEILTDRTAPVTLSWESHDDDEDENEGDCDDDSTDTGDGADETLDYADADADPDAGNGTGHVNDTPANAEAAPVASRPLTPRPFPTADNMSGAQSGPLAA